MNESDFMNNSSDNPSNNHQDGTKIVERYRKLNDLFDTIHYGNPITFDQLRRTMEMLGKSYSTFRLKIYAEEININSKKLIDRHHFIQLYHHLLDIQIKDGPAHLAAVKIQSILRRRSVLREQKKRNEAAIVLQTTNRRRSVQKKRKQKGNNVEYTKSKATETADSYVLSNISHNGALGPRCPWS